MKLLHKMLGFIKPLLLLFFFVNCIAEELNFLAEPEYVTLNIKDGPIQGRKLTTQSGTPYYSFQGIPYAAPPLGNLRFKPPEPPLPWEGTRNVTKQGSSCPQLLLGTILTGDEDCLFLNVYTPQVPDKNSNGLNLTVMVFIHGGGFYMMSGNAEYFGHEFLVDEHIVLVTINYRLGVLGFLGLDHPDVSKNNGLKDQVAALKWVQDNVAYFGGNPEDVTIYGESAGGASTHYQLLSTTTKGLFHRAISMSGSALNTWAFAEPDNAHNRAVVLAQSAGCNSSDVSDIYSFLQNADANLLIQLQADALTDHDIEHGLTNPFVPTIEKGENAFITERPLDIIKKGQFHQIPYITGVVSEEGKYFALDIKSNESLWPSVIEHFEDNVPDVLDLKPGSSESLTIAQKIKDVYYGNESISADTIEQYVHLKSDTEIITGVHRTLDLHVKHGTSPVYFYVFSYVGRISLSEMEMYDYSFPGAAHGDDMMYLMTPYSLNIPVDSYPEEIKVIHYMTKLWTNFAKYGDPTYELDMTWNPVKDDENSNYLNIDTELSLLDLSGFEYDRMKLWDGIYKNFDVV